MKNRYILLWILSLAALSVGARNFEQGMSIDGPLYATIAQQIARTGEWFRLDCRVPDFIPFAEHTHLGFWLQAFVFKFLPQADWSARIVGHLSYVGFLFIFFSALRKYLNERVAVFAVLFLWIWPGFSNYFSIFYLDAPALFFGSLFLYFYYDSLLVPRLWKSILAGSAFAAIAMTKGLLALGFVPIAMVLLLLALHRFGVAVPCLKIGGARLAPRNGGSVLSSKGNVKALKDFLSSRVGGLLLIKLTFLLVSGVYIWSVLHSQVPDFFQIYWTHQMSNRFSRLWSWGEIFDLNYWKVLLQSTFYLALLIPLFVARSKNKMHYVVPSLFLLSFVLMFAPARRIGGQYNLFLLPSLAWMLALGADEFLSTKKFSVMKVVHGSQTVALALVVILQYLPFPSHNLRTVPDTAQLSSLFSEHADWPRVVYVYSKKQKVDFLSTGPLAWYGDVRVVDGRRNEDEDFASVLLAWDVENAAKERLELKYSWCRVPGVQDAKLFIRCGN